MKTSYLTALCAQLASFAYAQSSCPSPSGSIRPSVASGYALQVFATGLSKPRGVAFDAQGHLLVVQQGPGTITSHTVSEDNGCVVAGDSTTVVSGGLNLNHGIWINGSTLYASNTESVFSWEYDASSRTVSNQQELINGMTGSDHSTRTLLLTERAPGMLVVSRGSTSNLDNQSTTIEGGTAQVRAFNLNNRNGIYDWQDGLLLGWGVRNEVGLAEHPNSGGIYGVENSADQIVRDGVDVSNNNPGEELNFFGYLNGTQYENQGGYFGYPWCLSVWNTTELPSNQNLSVGEQFAFDAASSLDNQNRTDQFCASDAVNARLVFQAHMAPLDLKFNNSGTEGYVTFHGSWNRKVPVGYKLSLVNFQENGDPVEASDSNTAALDIVSNMDNTACPNNCLRPVAMAFDTQGRIFMSSDASGEIYLVTRNAAANGTNGSSPAPASNGTASSPSTTASSGAARSFTSPALWSTVALAIWLNGLRQ